MVLWYFSTITFLATGVLAVKKVPDYIHVCSRNDPNIAQCVTNTVESMRDKLIEGLPELGVPSIEPLIIEEPISTQGAGISVTTKDLKAYGGGNFSIKNLEVDLNSMKYRFSLSFPHLAVEGHYNVDGKIIMIPIKGDGALKCDVYDVNGTVEMDSQLENINGINEMRFLSMKIDVAVKGGKIHLSNLFGGDKLIGEVINAAINLNFQYFVNELKPIIQDTLSHFIIKSANKICEGLNYDELLPE